MMHSPVSRLCIIARRQSHEIFDLHFFHKSMAPRVLINTLKYFLILFRFRAEINEIILCPKRKNKNIYIHLKVIHVYIFLHYQVHIQHD
jgi:hypothetical protein